MFIHKSLYLFVTICLMLGCTNTKFGRPINTSEIQYLESGHTNTDDLVKRFGQPDRKVSMSEGEIWVYRHIDGNGFYGDLIISVNTNSLVVVHSAEGANALRP
jgi:hypothetical protein